MDLLEIFAAWKNLRFWNQLAFMLTFFGFVLGALSLTGVHMELISISFVLLISAVLLFAKGNFDQSKELTNAKKRLNQVDERISQATASVYTQKNDEIRRLELNLTTWKDKAGSYQDKLSICESERDQWKDDCRFLHEIRNRLMTEKQELQERLQRCHELHPESNPTHIVPLTASIVLRPSTPEDNRLGEIHRRLT